MDNLVRLFQQLRGNLGAWLGKLSQRERVMVSVMAAAVFLFAVTLVSLKFSHGITDRERRVEDKTRLLSEVSKLSVGFRERQAERQALEGRLKGPQVQLLSYISQQGAPFQIEVNDVKPAAVPDQPQGLKEDAVEVNLARVDLVKLTRFLQSLERGPGVVKVRRLRLSTRSDDPRQVDATFTVSAYGLKT